MYLTFSISSYCFTVRIKLFQDLAKTRYTFQDPPAHIPGQKVIVHWSESWVKDVVFIIVLLGIAVLIVHYVRRYRNGWNTDGQRLAEHDAQIMIAMERMRQEDS